MKTNNNALLPYRESLAGTLLAAREAVMAPLRPMLRAEGLSEQQWRLLRILFDEKAMDLTGLARTALLHPPSMTHIIRDMVAKGLLEREPDATDRRRALLQITDHGRRVFERISTGAAKVVEHQNSSFGSMRLERLRHELKELAEILTQFSTLENAGDAEE